MNDTDQSNQETPILDLNTEPGQPRHRWLGYIVFWGIVAWFIAMFLTTHGD